MPNKTPPFKNYPVWTTARFFGFLRSGLREKFNRWPVKYKVLQNASRETVATDADGTPIKYKTGKKAGQIKLFKQYQCAKCEEWFKNKEVQVDHIVPSGKLSCFEDLGPFAERMFTNETGLQVLCYPCHQVKTNKESKR